MITKRTMARLTVFIITAILISVMPVNTVADNDIERYKLVRVFSVDPKNNTVRAETMFDLNRFDMEMIDAVKLQNIESKGIFEVFGVSSDCLIYIDSVQKSISDIKPETYMLIAVENNLITRMTNVGSLLLQEGGIYSGILEENNPDLGYITLYFPDGSGTSPELKNSLSYYRTYSYIRAEDVVVYKNGELSNVEALKPGDSVFVKLDNEGNIVKISATDNFYPVYGKVKTKGTWMLQLEMTDGSTVLYRIPLNTPIFRDKRMASWSDIRVGDEVRILLQTSGNQVIIGEIAVKSEKIQVEAVYKAYLTSYNRFDNSIIVMNMQQFKDGIWDTSNIPVTRKLPVNENYIPSIPKGAYGTVYLATGKSITGKDTVVWMCLDNEGLRSEITGDTVVDADPGRGRITLMNRNVPVSYDDTSIIVKKGKLLDPSQVKSMDEAYFVTSNQVDGSVKANIIWIREPFEDTGLSLIRGRISQIDLFSSMTLETFSEFSEPKWEYYNVAKTLTIDPSITRVFDDGGRMDLAHFDDSGTNSFKKRTVYVLAQDGKALLVSTAPFGDVVYKGRILDLQGVQKDSFNHVVVPATSLIIKDGVRYNDTLLKWENVPEAQFSFEPNTVFMKNGKIIDASQLEAGDRITVIKSESGDSAFVIMVESF